MKRRPYPRWVNVYVWRGTISERVWYGYLNHQLMGTIATTDEAVYRTAEGEFGSLEDAQMDLERKHGYERTSD